MATNAPQDDFQKTALRLPKELHARVHQEAADEGRSYNAQLIHIVQQYFDGIEHGVKELTAGLDKAREEWGEFGLANWADREALLKVLLLDEIMLLRRRVARLGGREAILKLPKREVVRAAADDKLRGTVGDRVSHFSQTVGTWPLTALLTDDELSRIAQRIVAMQDSMQSAAAAPAAPVPPTAEDLRRERDDPQAVFRSTRQVTNEFHGKLPEAPAEPKLRKRLKKEVR